MLRIMNTWPIMGSINILLLFVALVSLVGVATSDIRAASEDFQSFSAYEMRKGGSKWAANESGEMFIFVPHVRRDQPVPAEEANDELLTPIPPRAWSDYPVIPAFISQSAKEIYLRGIAFGNNPHAFSVIGDAQSDPEVFMGIYDTGMYELTAGHEHLQETIAHFTGSFARRGATVIAGGTPASVLARGWFDLEGCNPSETPLECELRVHNPVIAFVNLGTHWTDKNATYLQQVVEVLISHGTVPILATKADNLEGNHNNNREMARIAQEYGLPLWNFWAEVQDLPHGGLDPIRQGGYMYLTEEALALRRLSALQALDAVWRNLISE